MQKKLFKLLFPTFLYLIPITAAIWLYGFSIHQLGDYIYSQTAKPFLQNGELVIKPHPKLTIKPSLIEFQVLKVNSKPVKK